MTNGILILRPQPGADRTAEKVTAAGFAPRIWPLFEIKPRSWTLPTNRGATAILLTSANAVRKIGGVPAELVTLPAYCVGSATAKAAVRAGFNIHHVGADNAEAVLATMAGDGHRGALHFRGRDVTQVSSLISITPIITYAAEVMDTGLPNPDIMADHIVLLHSQRAARRFDELVKVHGFDRATIRLVVISKGALEAAGTGWGTIALAKAPNDAAMIEAARTLSRA